jgi:hypothetical protein
MKKDAKIDFAKLLGFALMEKELVDAIDFQDDTLGAKLGAKVGDLEANPSPEE